MRNRYSDMKSENLSGPGKSMSEDEFKVMIKDGEKGPFISLEKLKENFHAWISKAEK